jgi:hypothetical protein
MGDKHEARDLLRRASAYATEVEKSKLNRRNAMASCQKAIELSVQAIYAVLGLEFRIGHESLTAVSGSQRTQWLQRECARLQEVELPPLFPYGDRLAKTVFVQFFWSDMHELAESAREGPASVNAEALLGGEEIRLLQEHARFCYTVCKSLLDLQ